MTVTTPIKSFSPKFVGETIFLPPVSFADQLSEGDTISAATVTATVYSGGPDGSPSDLLATDATTDGVTVIQEVTTGVGGTVYKILYTVTTAKDESFEQEWLLPVVSE